MFNRKLKDDIEYLKEDVKRVEDTNRNITKQVRLLLEYFESKADDDEVRRAIEIIKKGLAYY